MSVFAQRKRIVPDKGFYLTDIISEKTPFEGTALVGGGKYDAKMRHQKNPFCEKKYFKKYNFDVYETQLKDEIKKESKDYFG